MLIQSWTEEGSANHSITLSQDGRLQCRGLHPPFSVAIKFLWKDKMNVFNGTYNVVHKAKKKKEKKRKLLCCPQVEFLGWKIIV